MTQIEQIYADSIRNFGIINMRNIISKEKIRHICAIRVPFLKCTVEKSNTGIR